MSDCPDPAVLEAFARGALDPGRRHDIELHLDRCSGCGTLLGQLAQLYGTESSRATAGPTSAAAQADLGELEVGRYRLGRVLGAGGMGVVYEAVDPELHRRVAIKLLHPGVGGDVEATRGRMLREARAMAQLAHPNVVAVHDVGRVGEQVFVAMELVEGTTLTRWLQTPRTRREILAVFVQAGRGLEAAHAVGLVHRDFKPDNVLIGGDGRARVTDFGLARPALSWPEGASDSAAIAATAAGLGMTSQHDTAAGAIVGTPAYMAPEQWRGAVADARSDQFSFCVALYEACFGTRPFAASGFYELAEQVLRGNLKPPPRGTAAWLRAAIVRGLGAEPERRHPSMAVLLAALERDRTRALRIAGVIGAMGISVGATVGVLAWTAGAASPAPPLPTLTDPPREVAPASVPPDPAQEVAPAPDPARAACIAKIADAQGRWRAPRRDELSTRVRTMENGAAIETRALPILDAWARRWSELAETTCAPDPAFIHTEARTRCLAASLLRFDALVQQALELPTFSVDDALASAARRLPDLAVCERPAWLATAPAAAPVEHAGQAALVAAELATAEALTHLEQLTGAPDAAQRVVDRALAIGHAPLVAEAQLALGIAQADKYETDAAIAALEAAAATAQGGVHERVFVRAAAMLVELHGGAALRPSDAVRWQGLLAPSVSRTDDPWLGGVHGLAAGVALHGRAEYRSALASFAAARPLLVDALGDRHPEIARLDLAAAATHLALDEADLAETRAAAAQASLLAGLGATDLRHAAAMAMLGRIALVRGELDEAAELAERASKVPVFSQSLRHDFDHGRYLGLLGDVLAARGATADALAIYDKAKIYLYVDAAKAEPLLWQARVLVDAGDVEAGLERVAEALVEIDASLGSDDPRRVEPLCAIGRAQRRAKRIDQGRSTLERALAIAELHWGFGPRTSLVRWELAELEVAAGQPARALALYDDAHVPLVGAFEQHHPRMVTSLLARADLAWGLGQREYAERLYGSIAADLMKQRGGKDGGTIRARDRGPRK